jgi:RNA polymerase sigma factor (sigma-70 family)
MVGGENGKAALSILEFYREHRHEIEVLEDTKALFVLTFIAETGNTSIADLVSNLGWPEDEISSIIRKLSEAQLLRDTVSFSAENPIRLASNGLSMMATLRFPKKEERTDKFPETAWRDAFPFFGLRGFSRYGPPSLFKPRPRLGYVQEDPADLELLNAARSGNQQAAASLFERYRNFVLSVAWAYLRNDADAEDALQRTFLKLIQGPPRDPVRPVKPLIRVVAQNTAIDMLRERTRRHEEPIEEAEKQEQRDVVLHWHQEEQLAITRSLYLEMLARVGILTEPHHLLRQYERDLAYGSLYRAVTRLTPEDRAVWLYFLEGLTTREIAQEMHITDDDAYRRLRHTVFRLRRLLKGALDESKKNPPE